MDIIKSIEHEQLKEKVPVLDVGNTVSGKNGNIFLAFLLYMVYNISVCNNADTK